VDYGSCHAHAIPSVSPSSLLPISGKCISGKCYSRGCVQQGQCISRQYCGLPYRTVFNVSIQLNQCLQQGLCSNKRPAECKGSASQLGPSFLTMFVS